jgi:glycosyltransferase involved in cell wall biosynthesis
MIRERYPLVSVVTPSLNQGRFIEETILSIQRQDYPNLEHIIIDGGSTDETVKILKKYEGTYNLRWVSEPDEGHADAVNKGFAMAQGEIIGWLNSDDVYFDRGTIRAVVEAFQKYPEADIIYGDVAYIREDGTIWRIQCVPGFRYSRLLRGCFLEQPGVFFRRYVVEEHKLDKRLQVAIDYEYWLRIGRLYRFVHIPRILAADRNHGERISVAQADKLKAVGDWLRQQYLGQPSLGLRLEWELDKLLSGSLRRMKGLIRLFRLLRKKDFAFNGKVVLNPRTLRNQLFPPRLERWRG